MCSPKDTNDLEIFSVVRVSCCKGQIPCFIPPTKQVTISERISPQGDVTQQNQKKELIWKALFFSAFRYPSPLNNVLELPWIFFLSYSTGRNLPKGALKFHFFITSFYNYVLWFRHESLTSWGFFQPCNSCVALVNTT